MDNEILTIKTVLGSHNIEYFDAVVRASKSYI